MKIGNKKIELSWIIAFVILLILSFLLFTGDKKEVEKKGSLERSTPEETVSKKESSKKSNKESSYLVKNKKKRNVAEYAKMNSSNESGDIDRTENIENEESGKKKNILANLDSDGDGLVSMNEFKGPDSAFDKIDKNYDGFISPEEMSAMFKQIDKIRRTTTTRRRVGNLPDFEEMDADEDGSISINEFKGADKLFDQMDQDGDELISAEEMETSIREESEGGMD